MADKKEIQFHLKTTGDPKGAKEVERAIDSAADAAESLGTSTSGGTVVLERDLRDTATAAQAADKAVEALENSIEQLNEEIAKNRTLTTDQVSNLKRVVDGGERLVRIQRTQKTTTDAAAKSTGNLGMGALAAAQAFEDMQYGIRGVLNNIPQMVLMFGGPAGLAAAISVAAVAGTILFEKFASGTEKAKKETEDWVETLGKARKAFEDMEVSALERQAQRMAERARQYAAEIASIDFENRRGSGQEGIEARRIEGERLVALANNRLEIARVETALVSASGAEATRLAERRKKLAEETAQIELAALERRRELEEQKARRELGASERRDEAAKGGEARALQEYNQVASEQEGLFKLAHEAAQARFLAIAELRDEIATMTAEIQAIEAQPFVSASIAAKRASQVQDLKRQIEARDLAIQGNVAPGDAERNARAAGEAMTPRLNAAAEALKSASEEQRKTSAAVADAMLALKDLRDSQAVDRSSEQQVRDAERQIEIVRGPDQSAAVNSLGNLTDQLEGSPELAGVMAQIKSFVSDKTLTADELAKTQVLLGQYFARIANIGATQNSAIREAMAKVDDLEREVRTLRSNQQNAYSR